MKNCNLQRARLASWWLAFFFPPPTPIFFSFAKGHVPGPLVAMAEGQGRQDCSLQVRGDQEEGSGVEEQLEIQKG